MRGVWGIFGNPSWASLQYCVVRPATTLTAIALELSGKYHETDFSWSYGYVYIMLAINASIFYAMVVLVTFYLAMKVKLQPFEPVGKFICIKFVIFFAFWQVTFAIYSIIIII